jgi:CheY-like chemotaxis protein
MGGNASLLVAPGTSPAEVGEHAQEIVDAAERATTLTRQLLLFSRKQVMQATDLDLNAVVSNVTKMLQRILGADISLRAETGPGLPLIHADPGMIEQALLNLAVNARDAMPGGGRLTISTDLRIVDGKDAVGNPEASAGTYVRLSVSDSGSGIPADILPRIFEPFFTTKEPGKGTGLGLASVYGIVKQHRGWVDVESEPDHGATFRIYFPAAERVVAPAPPTPLAAPLHGGSETILLVEDEQAVRQMVASALTRTGYRVLQAVSGAAALGVWRDHKDEIDLLLTDMVMPDGVSGPELAERLAAERPDLKIIYTSGYSAELTASMLSLEEGVNFLQKPYRLRKLTQTVRDRLDKP